MGIFALSLGGCAPSTPDLPQDSSPEEVKALVASADGNSFLKQISTYHWDDRGAAAANLFTWIPEWAGSPDSHRQEVAGQTAYTVATFLGNESPSLLNIEMDQDSQHLTIGDVNPTLVATYTNTVIPYLGSTVGDEPLPRGFKQLDSLDSSMPRTYSMLSVLSTDEASSAKLGQAILELIKGYQKVITDELQSNDNDAANSATLKLARLVGLASSSGITPPESEPLSFNIGDEQTELDFILARASATGPNSDITPRFFSGDNSLMPPGLVRTRLGEAAWEEYSGMLSRYVARSNDLRNISNSFAHTSDKIVKGNHR